tara:strand:- start:1619 stop:1855 length:237 start_codon:yes stop_codon:yes gene_type:complete
MTFTHEFAQNWLRAKLLLLGRSKNAFEVRLRCKSTQDDLFMLHEQGVLDLDEYTHALSQVLTSRAVRLAQVAIQEACV